MHAKDAPFRDAPDDDAFENNDDDDDDARVPHAITDHASTSAAVVTPATTKATQSAGPLADAKVIAAVACAAAALALACVKIIRSRLGGGPDRAFAKSHRKCNRCGKRGANTRCDRCKRAWYCSSACRSAAWKMEICECC